jgi:hypothetical protein
MESVLIIAFALATTTAGLLCLKNPRRDLGPIRVRSRARRR